MPTSVQALVRKHRPIWNITVRNPFVTGVHDGTLPREMFDGYLVQAHHLVEAHFAPTCRLLAAAPRQDRPLLLEGVELLRSEVEWYQRLLAERGLDPSTPARPAILAMRSQLVALGFEPYVVGIVAFWAQAKTYADAWTSKRPHSGAHRDFLERWGSRRSGAFARRLGRAADRAIAGARPRDRDAAEEAFLVVVRHKLAYWTAALG